MVFVSLDVNIVSVLQEVLCKYLLISNGIHHYKELLREIAGSLILKSFRRKENAPLTRGLKMVLEGWEIS